MLKYVLAGTTALAIAGGSLAYAQKGPDGGKGAERWRPTAEDMAAFGDARIAGLKAGLKLTPEQEKNWPAVETALRDFTKQRSERFAARASADRSADKPVDRFDRLSQRADAMAQQGAALKKLVDAAGPLYKSLDEPQKKRFWALAKLGGERGGWQRGHHRGHDRMHHGPRGSMGGPGGPGSDAPRPQ
ncbi:MAG TPA: Spy/CpxP family protein refolding chaperone [Pseudolabrys sp.]|nr:Spy/CpxP family protein refolding chaperone [Pseudolabrys sp.]